MKVVDLSTGVAGQWAAKLFAMAGAEVVRPDGGERPDQLARYLDEFKHVVPWPGTSLVEGADLVFTTFDAGRMIGYAADLTLPEKCVEVTTSSFGMTGPYAHLRGGPIAAWAAGGYLYITGEPDREPLIGPEHICEYVNGYTAAVAAEAALRDRLRTGGGQRVDIGAMESMIPMHQSTFGRFALGEPRRRTGRYYEVYPLATWRCRDGYVKLCIVTDEEYDRFLTAIGRLDMLADQRFADRESVIDHKDDFDRELAPFLEGHDAAEIVDLLASFGVVAAQVAEVEDVLANPQLVSRGFWAHGFGPGNPVPATKIFGPATPPHPSPLARSKGRGGPLEGVVVVDFSVFWAGPLATRTLADLGARVIWVERPRSRVDTDPTKDRFSLVVSYAFHLKMNRNKESVVLDLTTPEGQSAARRLVANADVVVENNRPGVMDRLGLGPTEMCSADPRLVYVSLSGWGSSGPWANRRSYGPAIEAASSIEGRTGYRGGEPLRMGHPLPDGIGGLAGAYAVLRGLRERDECGVGGWFDMSQLETYVAASGEDLVDGVRRPRIGNSSRWGYRLGIYPCRGDDEWIALRLIDTSEEEAFAAVTGVDPRDEAAVCAYSSLQDRMEMTLRLQNSGLEAFPVLKPEDLVVDPQLRHRGFHLESMLGDHKIVLPGTPLYPLANPAGLSPTFGQHTASVLAEIASLPADESGGAIGGGARPK